VRHRRAIAAAEDSASIEADMETMMKADALRATTNALALGLAPLTALAAPSYTLIDLGTLGGSYSQPACCTFTSALNGSGQVTGYAYTTGDSAFHAFLWNGASTQDLGTLGGTSSQGLSINASGQVTGIAYTTGNSAYHAFLWNGTAMQDLGTLGGTYSQGYGINASGQVTGYAYTTGNSAVHAFLWNGASMQDLGTLGGSYSYGYQVNDSGIVAGLSATAGGEQHAFVYDGASMIDLGTFGGTVSYAFDLNAAGEVVGYAYTTGNTTFQAFLWDGTSTQNLGTLLPGQSSEAYAINDLGDAVGVSGSSATLWSGGAIYDLNTLIAPGSGWTLYYASDINDAGQIAAYGYDATTGQSHALLLDPVTIDEPATLAMLGIGLGAIAVRRTRRVAR
jgi:probable HAF family extracellular repeat protein